MINPFVETSTPRRASQLMRATDKDGVTFEVQVLSRAIPEDLLLLDIKANIYGIITKAAEPIVSPVDAALKSEVTENSIGF